jgi:glycosyltransferase involved in cell wall biosynthesis
MVAAEAEEVSWCDAAVAVSPEEKRLLERGGLKDVDLLTYRVSCEPTLTAPRLRKGLLFVGSLVHAEPNLDAMRWYCTRVHPTIHGSGPRGSAILTIVGRYDMATAQKLEGDAVHLVGHVADARPYFEEARVFVAPMRFGAGIPVKVIEAAAQGVPVVGTSLVANLLEWRDGEELLVADDEAAFAHACQLLMEDDRLWEAIRARALTRVSRDYSPAAFRAAVARITK